MIGRLGILATALLIATQSVRAVSADVIGYTTIPNGTSFGKTLVGGLSGISYDAETRTFWAISDDSINKGGPPRAYQLAIQFDSNGIHSLKILKVLPLRNAKGQPIDIADCEGISATGHGGIWVASEGRGGVPPFVQLFDLTDGSAIRDLPLPSVFLPKDATGKFIRPGSPAQISGFLPNKSLESCAISPDLQTVYIANETSLLQEKALGEGKGGASLFNRTQVRISALDAQTGVLLGQKLYQSDAGCMFGSISDLVSLDDHGKLLVLERRVTSLSEGPGACNIRIYNIDFGQDSATDLRDIPNVNANSNVVPLKKNLVFDSSEAGIDNLDNVEGICVAPLPDGSTALVGISDNNFDKAQQTQIWLFRYSKSADNKSTP
ncbi:MAG TPA: esterase-like activity of phytase family protein [Chthoniobacterales bacterium]